MYKSYFIESNSTYQVILKRPIDKNILSDINKIISDSNAKFTDKIELGETIFEVSFDSSSNFGKLIKSYKYFGKIAKV